MGSGQSDIVTGAFGYSGKYITRLLLQAGNSVSTLTSRPIAKSPFGQQVSPMPLCFHDQNKLTAQLRGIHTLYNTYWVRFCHGRTTFDSAVRNTMTLIESAKTAGVQRFVHVSITNPSLSSPLPYFSGKAQLEQALMASGMSYAIVRPTVIFGPEDILINNIAWLLRRLPVFGLFGDGQYPIQPVFVEDFATLVVQAGNNPDNTTIDAVGPETYSYAEMVTLIRDAIGSKSKVVRLHPTLALLAGTVLGKLTHDTVITREEIDGLMAGLLVSHEPPTGNTSLRDWLTDNASKVGATYSSELRRHYR